MRVRTFMPQPRFVEPHALEHWGTLILAVILAVMVFFGAGCAAVIPDYNTRSKGLGQKVEPDLLVRIPFSPYICAPKGEEWARVTIIVVPRGMEPGELYIEDNGVSVILPPDTGYTGHLTAGLGRHVITFQMNQISKSRTYYVVKCKQKPRSRR
jgi:hypothetical protein